MVMAWRTLKPHKNPAVWDETSRLSKSKRCQSTNHLYNMRYMPVQVTLMLIICVGKPITVTYLGSV